MDHKQITKRFLEYFKSKKHLQIPDAPLIPAESDPSALFTSSGMHAIKPYFLGLVKSPAKRLCNIQKCIRTGDIDDVGKDGRHLTFFFMLGSWSVGDYWKEEACGFAYELLTKVFGFDKNKLWASIFAGDKELGLEKDEEVMKIWEALGIPRSRMTPLPAKDNFWAGGPTGPCGPTSEIYFDQGEKVGCGKKDCKPGCDCDRFLEIWNACVQMAYDRKADGKLVPLKLKNIDAGAGLERFAAVLQKTGDVFLTSCFKPLIEKIEKLSGKKYSENKKAFRIVADHLRAAVFITAEGLAPGKKDREYVLRRIIRRLTRFSNELGLKKENIEELAVFVIKDFEKEYPYLAEKKSFVPKTIGDEYDKFTKTLGNGIKLLSKLISELKKQKLKQISSIDVFHLYDTLGFPMELTKEIAKENNFEIDEKGFEKEFEKHKEISKVGSEKKFVSGLADNSEQVIKYHTATHLLHQALRDVLGKNVFQKGSNITPERLRFDFSYNAKMTDEQIKKVEEIVNKKIKESLEIKKEELAPEEAKKKGAIGLFDAKYQGKVLVYSIGNYSKEICSGPHVKNTSELGKFKIIKEEAVAAGVRRVKAVLE